QQQQPQVVRCQSGGTQPTIQACQQQDAQRQHVGNQAAQCWIFPNGGTSPATANSTPPVSGAKLGACTNQRSSVGSNTPPVRQPPISTPAVHRGVAKAVLPTARHSDNCVLYARDRVPSLPTGLD